MSNWPEIRAAYNTLTGKELARASLDDFLGFTVHHYVNGSDYSSQKREALWKTLYNEPIEGAEFEVQADSLQKELDALQKKLSGSLE